MSTLWIILLSCFLFAADYTVQNNHIPKFNLKPDRKTEETVIYYDKFENIGEDGIHTVTKDSVIFIN